MIPVRRDLHFDLSRTDVRRWNGHGPLLSHYMNALSVFFPEGERFFIHSVRNYRDRITDPELKAAVTAFIGQEAMHGREHDDYNARVGAAGLPAPQLEAYVTALLTQFKRFPKPLQLAITVGLEHFTAIYADLLLSEPRLLEGADPALSKMWLWHALEETEHKAVVYDVYQKVIGRGVPAYALRTATLAAITGTFLLAVFVFQARLVAADRQFKPGVSDWAHFGWVLFGPLGGIRRLAKPWLDFFKPGFHPWHHANQHHLARIETLAEEIEALPLAA